ncbi:MAG: SPOR domain-containing protein [Pseudomonadota bacterium]
MASNRIGWLLRGVKICAVACISFSPVTALGDRNSVPNVLERSSTVVEAGVLGQSTASTGGATSPFLKAAPELFDATGLAVWDGKRTLQGVWVAHPLATSARRVRIFNDANGLAVDGALFKRDSTLSGASVLISSEAAGLLKMDVDTPTKLRIVAVTPARRNQSQDVAAAPSTSSTSQSAPKEAEQPASQAAASTPKTETPAPQPEPPEAPAATETPSEDTSAVAAAPSTAPSTGVSSVVETTPTAQAQPETRQASSPEQSKVPASRPEPEPKTEPTVVAAAPATTSPEPESDPKTGPLNLTEPNLAATQPDRATTATVSSGSGQVAVSGTDSRPAIGAVRERPVARRSANTATSPKPKAPAKTEPEKTVVAQASSPLSRPFVQAGIFGVAQNAQKLISRLQSADIPAVGKPIRYRGQSATRVLAGPFQTSADRRAAQQVLRRFGINDAVPVRR